MSRTTGLLMCNAVLVACLTVAALSVAAPEALAVTVFSDGSENSTVGVIPATTDPTIGDWDFQGNEAASTIRTRTGATTDGPSAAFSGSNYLETSRGPDNQVPQIGAAFSSPVNVTTDSLHAEFQLHFKAATFKLMSFSFQNVYQYVPWTDNANQLVPIFFGDINGAPSTELLYWDGDSIEATGKFLTDNAWNHVAMDWNANTDQFTVTLNGGAPWVAPVVGGTATSISLLKIWPASSVTPSGFLDDVLVTTTPVPEPSTWALLAMGLVGFAVYVRWKRG